MDNNFAHEAEYQVTTTDRAREVIRNRLNVHHKYVNSTELSITEDYRIQMRGKEFKVTKQGFTEILRTVGLTSKNLWKRVSPKTLQLVFNDLKTKTKGKKWQLFTRDHTIINVESPPYHPVTTLEVLDMIDDDLADAYEVKEITVSDRGLKASIIDPELELHPSTRDVGEITKVGINMEGSDTGFKPLTVSTLLYRLRCRNGAIAGDKYGGLKWEPENFKNRNIALRRFKLDLRNLSLDTNRLVKDFKQLYESNLLDSTFWAIWKQVHSIIGTTGETDDLVGVDKDRRLEIQKAVKQRKRYYKKRYNTSEIPGKPTDLSAFEIYNAVTDQASHYSFVTQRSLERVGGDLLDLVTENGTRG